MGDAEGEVNFTMMTTPHDKVHYPATNQAHYCWWVFWSIEIHPWDEAEYKSN